MNYRGMFLPEFQWKQSYIVHVHTLACRHQVPAQNPDVCVRANLACHRATYVFVRLLRCHETEKKEREMTPMMHVYVSLCQ